ncbi:MAG: sensor histidine kinase, partial [Agromyces sp.]
AIPSAIAVMARPRPSTWAYLPVMGAFAGNIAARTSQSDYFNLDGLLTGLYDMAFAGIFVALVFVALVWTERLDARLAEDAHAEAEARAEEAQQRERQRFEALVHDGVISTLLVASRGAGEPEAIARQARTTLRQLQGTGDGPDTLSFAELHWLFTDAVQSGGPNLEWRHSGTTECTLPRAVGHALSGATAEAVRNVVRHASPAGLPGTIAPVVELQTGEQWIEVTVSDAGIGFDSAEIAPARLGIQHSIVERMHAVGGSAEIISRPGEGTRVVIRWKAAS